MQALYSAVPCWECCVVLVQWRHPPLEDPGPQPPVSFFPFIKKPLKCASPFQVCLLPPEAVCFPGVPSSRALTSVFLCLGWDPVFHGQTLVDVSVSHRHPDPALLSLLHTIPAWCLIVLTCEFNLVLFLFPICYSGDCGLFCYLSSLVLYLMEDTGKTWV